MLAAQCVAEAPQPADLAEAGDAVLRQVVLLVEHGISADDPQLVELTEQELLSSIRALGPDWPGRTTFLHWFRRRGIRTSWRTGSAFATRIAAALSTADERLEDLLLVELGQGTERHAHLTLVAGLAEAAARMDSSGRRRYRDLLLAQARAEVSTTVRQAAIRALVTHFGADPDLPDVLRGLVDSADLAVRALAVQSLGGRTGLSDDVRQMVVRATHGPRRHGPPGRRRGAHRAPDRGTGRTPGRCGDCWTPTPTRGWRSGRWRACWPCPNRPG